MKTRTVAHKVFGWGTNSGFADEAITMNSIENMSNQDIMAQCISELPRQHGPDTVIPSTAPYPRIGLIKPYKLGKQKHRRYTLKVDSNIDPAKQLLGLRITKALPP